jgi:hypothetical protein
MSIYYFLYLWWRCGVWGCGRINFGRLGGTSTVYASGRKAGKEAKIIFTWYLVRPPTSSLPRCTVTSLYAVLHDATEWIVSTAALHVLFVHQSDWNSMERWRKLHGRRVCLTLLDPAPKYEDIELTSAQAGLRGKNTQKRGEGRP